MIGFNEAYPEDRLAQTESALRKMWAGNVKTVFSSNYNVPEYRQLEDFDAMLDIACERIPAECDLPGLNIPRFMPDLGTTSLPAFWGGRRYRSSSGKPWVDPVIRSADDSERVMPSAPDGGDVRTSYELWKKLSDMLGTDRLPCSYLDVQGPLNQASLIWEQQDFFAALYEEPAKVHRLLERITEHTIEVIRAFREKIPTVCAPLWPYIWLPGDIGIAVVEDLMPLLSPGIYREFGLPYLERLSEEFGGLFLHCCGKFGHQFENLKKTKADIIGLEFHYPEVMPKEIFNYFGSSVVFVAMRSARSAAEFADTLDYQKYIQSKRLKETRLWYILSANQKTYDRQVEFVQSTI